MKTLTLFAFLAIPFLNSAVYSQPFWEKIADFNAYSFAFGSQGTIYVGSDSGTAYRSTDNGSSWSLMDIRPTAGLFDFVTQFELNSQGLLFAYIGPRGLHMSSDNGVTWPEIHGTDFATDLLIDNNNIYLPVSNGDILFSTNNGSNWSNLPMSSVHGIAINNQGHLFAGTYNQGIFRSTDNGSSWHSVLLSGNITCWHLEVTPDQKIHALYGSYFVSEDGGGNWTNRQSPGPGLVAQMSIYGNEVFVGHPGNAMYRTSNAGLNWELIDTSGLNGASLNGLTENQLAVDPQGYIYIYCRNFGNAELTGVYRSTQPVTSVVDSNPHVLKDFSLYQNYPNPFNPSTVISWQSPVGSHQILKVFDVLGNEVAALIDKYLPAGRHEVEFNASGLASGVYYYRIQTGEFSQSKKMILLR